MGTIMPILQVKMLRLKEFKPFAQNYTASESFALVLTQVCLIPEPVFLTSM